MIVDDWKEQKHRKNKINCIHSLTLHNHYDVYLLHVFYPAPAII